MLLRLAFVTAFMSSLPVMAVAADDDLVRLPGQGELKTEAGTHDGLGRLVPGGGLLLSFDADANGTITTEEVGTGIQAAFALADNNEDGRITPLEQVKWIETLPTRDQSLANPARFDPNLDRSVRAFEFEEIVLALAALHADAETGMISVEALKSDEVLTIAEQNPFPDE